MKPSIMIPSMSAQLSSISNASGSALFTIDDSTQVSCAVYHTEVKPRYEDAHKATIEVTWRPGNGKITNREKEYENVIRGCLEYAINVAQYPRSLIRVVIQIARDGNQLLSCALNSSMLALMNAGISMKTMLAACTFFTPEHGWAFLAYERRPGDSSSSSSKSSTDQVSAHLVSSHMEGFLFVDERESDEKLFDQYVKHGAKDIIPHIFNFFRETMVNNANM